MTQQLSSIEIEPIQPAIRSMIWLHGLGADGHDFVPFSTELHPAVTATMRFIFPHAPMMPITLNNGYTMRAWYDIYALAMDADTDVEGIHQSGLHVDALIKKELARGITPDHIFLGGFSQGAAMALIAGLSRQTNLGGILALSGYLPPSTELRDKICASKCSTPIFQAHGTLDPIVPYGLGLATYEWLAQNGRNIDWHTYPIAHSVCKEEIDDISTWLVKLIKNK